MDRQGRGAEREPPVVYSVDAADRLVAVNAAWYRFAERNGAPELVRPEVIGSWLWDFVAGLETRKLQRLVFERVRRTASPARMTFRCDSPNLLRFMELEISPAEEGGLVLSSRMLRQEPRQPVALLDPAVPRSNEGLAICSLCKRIPVDAAASRWLEADEAIWELGLFRQRDLPQLTHGVCPECRAQLCALVGQPPEP